MCTRTFLTLIKVEIVAYWDCGLSYRSIAARIGRDPMTVSRIWNRWVQENNMECHNARWHAAGIARTFLDTENFRFFPWPVRSSDLSPIENVWSMVAERLSRHHTPVTTVGELWHRVEAEWASVPVHATQFLFDSMPLHISAVITVRGLCSGY
ncbi:hypothetical protein TNCV_3016951 [Trichonephila clavipes]|nr:hypothetical protein TNCV_3016951 [Trichonephila clavipes]